MFGFGVPSVSATKLAERLSAGPAPLLIDVREPHEFAAGHLKNARSIPLGSLAKKAEKIDRDAEIYVICRSGNRSTSGTKIMRRMGFSAVTNVKGGMLAWRGEVVR